MIGQTTCCRQTTSDIVMHYKVKKASSCIPNPNSCSSRIPINRRLNMLASKWKTPACNHMQVIRRHPWCLLTTLFTSRAPIFSSLKGEKCRYDQLKMKSPLFMLKEALTLWWIFLLRRVLIARAYGLKPLIHLLLLL